MKQETIEGEELVMDLVKMPNARDGAEESYQVICKNIGTLIALVDIMPDDNIDVYFSDTLTTFDCLESAKAYCQGIAIALIGFQRGTVKLSHVH